MLEPISVTGGCYELPARLGHYVNIWGFGTLLKGTSVVL